MRHFALYGPHVESYNELLAVSAAFLSKPTDLSGGGMGIYVNLG